MPKTKKQIIHDKTTDISSETQELVNEIKEVATELKALNEPETSVQPEKAETNDAKPVEAEKSQEAAAEQNTDPKKTEPVDSQVVEDGKKDAPEPVQNEANKAETAPTEPVQTEPGKVESGNASSQVQAEAAPAENQTQAETTTKPQEAQSQPEATKPEENQTQGEAAKPVEAQVQPQENQPNEAQSQEPKVESQPEQNQEVEKEEKLSLMAKIKAKLPFGKKKTEQPPKAEQKKGKKTLKLIGIGVGVVLVLVIALGATTYLLAKPVLDNGQKTMTLAQEAYTLVKNQDLEPAKTKLSETKTALLATQKAYQKLSWLKAIPFVSTYATDAEAGLKAGVAGIEAGEILVDAVLPYADVLGLKGQGSFEGGTAEDRIVKVVETLDKVTPKLEEVSQKLQIVEDELDKIDPNDYPEELQGKSIRPRLIQGKALVAEAVVAVTDARPLVEVLPQILGYPTSKKYLVIFQNDGELRPTGGFMSAFAVINIDKGRTTPEKSDDIYSLDKKFGNKVEAPEPFKIHMNEDYWYLRNMNFSPDYYVSMTTFDKYYSELKDEYKVDGIIAIDTEVLRRMVEVTGPLVVDDYGTFTVENDPRCNLAQIVCELEHIVDKPLATVVTNRKTSILGPMMQALMKKSLGGGKEQLAKLVPLMFQLMEEKHLLVYFKDEKLQKAAEAFNIAGRINEAKNDYLHINDANLGGAKSNFYIDQEAEQDIEIADDGTVTKTLTITYTHPEPMDNCNLEAGDLCLSGKWRDYFRIYVPKGSKLEEGRGALTKITQSEDLDKTVFEGFFELYPEKKAKIIITYTLPFKVKAGDAYSMLVQKQPGTKNSKYIVRIKGQEEEFTLDKDTTKSWKI
ncbi:DUF4012 domain-containing protein [Candidatus Beckwithbacteria bacterium]|nr:DUF4012 domain-containing protein [Candidatus Beckwithbacteria bacterium]